MEQILQLVDHACRPCCADAPKDHIESTGAQLLMCDPEGPHANDPRTLVEKPRQKLPNGDMYSGQWSGPNMQGWGRLEREGLGVYEGSMVHNRIAGEGKLVKLNGDVFEGQWQNSVEHGLGTYRYSDGSSYQGQWNHGTKSGFAKEIVSDGASFEGQFVSGKRHGSGIYKSSDGSAFEGQFKHDLMDGEGQYTFEDGHVYLGQWVMSRIHGQGRMSWQTGMTYNGQFFEDKKSGDGKFSWPDGRMYEGRWQAGKQHGRGTFRTREGVPWTGHWLSGRRVDSNGQAIPVGPAAHVQKAVQHRGVGENPSSPPAPLTLPGPQRLKKESTDDTFASHAEIAGRSQVSMTDVKTENLLARFPGVTEAEVRATLASTGGHAGMAAAALKQAQHGVQESDKLPISPDVMGPEPIVPP